MIQPKNKPLKIYMGDLTHDTITLVSDTIPINIGFIASYAKKMFGSQIEISLYKFPQTLIDAIKDSPPDLLALSNYSWNSNLSEWMAGYGKRFNRDMLTVQGGTNFPHRDELQKDFLLTRPHTDIFIVLEGEMAFCNLIARALAARGDRKQVFEEAIDGCVFIQPETRESTAPVFTKGSAPERIKELDGIPSPYLNGMLDKFFEARLTPFLETNRGCPFTCTFCHTGTAYFNKMNQFSLERVEEEIRYIAPKMQKLGIKNLHIADTNFGMFPRDKQICEVLQEMKQTYEWPLHIMSTTGKNSKERIIEATQILGNTFSVNMSVQSMDADVLENIKRSNIKLEHYVEVNKSLNERGRSTKGELIVGLPGETRESFVAGLEKIINAGVSLVCTYSLMLLHGTQFQEPEYRKKYGITGKYRIVPLNFGEYEGEKVFDFEETGIANKDMSFEDYLWIRGLALMVEVIHNDRPFHELFMYASSYGITIFDFILKIYNQIDEAPDKLKEVFQSFQRETKGELWDTEEELIKFHSTNENYERLLHGNLGGNVIYKHKAMSLSHCSDGWVEFLGKICMDLVRANETDEKVIARKEEEISHIVEFVAKRLTGVLQSDGNIELLTMYSNYDVLGWRKAHGEKGISDFRLDSPIKYEFYYSEDQIAVRNDHFTRYGTNYNALSKIVTRVSNVESLFRHVRVTDSGESLKAEDSEKFIRYTLSN